MFGRSGVFITGDASADRLTGSAGDDEIVGRDGDDTLDGGRGADRMIGGADDDTYHLDDAGDVVVEVGGNGVDAVRTVLASYALGNNVENLTFDGAGAFAGTGNALDNVLTGGAGNDTLDGAAGADTMTGGAGNDTYQVDDAGDVVVEATGEGRDTVKTTLASYVLADGVERLQFVGIGDFSGTGNVLGNVLMGGAGNDTLDGDAGDDTLIGGTGADQMTGGEGNDIYQVDDAGDVVVEATGEGRDTVQTTLASYTLGANVERLLFGGTGAFSSTGNGLANLLKGGAGNDTFDGNAGDDTLIGGTGADEMTGGAGNDTYQVDDAGDVVVEATGEGRDTVQTTLTSYTLGADVERLQFVGTGAFGGTGNGLDNVLTGGAGNDTLDGDTGNDTLIGGAGADEMTGGDGNDTYQVDDAGDVVVELVGGGTDVVNAVLSTYSLGANVENLKFTGTGGFIGTGNELVNTIVGAAGDDTLDGGAGRDTLNGGVGDDVLIEGQGGDKLTGGTGANVFVFRDTTDSTRAARDAIADFAVGTDLIDLTQIDGGLHSLQTVTSAPATIGAHSLVAFAMGNGNTGLYANNTDAALSTKSASMEIVLKGVTAFGDADLDYLMV